MFLCQPAAVQESSARVAELEEQCSATAKQLAAKQQELAESQQLAQVAMLHRSNAQA